MGGESPIIVGRISGIYGVKGWVKVYSHTNPIDNITHYNPWLLRTGQGWQPRKVVAARQHGKGIVALLEDCHDRDHARALIDVDIGITREQLPALAPGEYYWNDLEGLSVEHIDGTPMGRVDHLFATGANDVMVVKGDVERLIPFVQGSVIVEIDLEKQLVKVDWPLDF
ncbi:MAG: ribosome maturation factor RimM [Gammaproteobacteria bacterium]|nr:ribosome maturation factor RimM [Gammaproteobacteria bacterium]